MQKKSDAPICEHCGFDERTGNLSHQLPPGTLLQNQYLVGRVLGQGGFGITYMGWDQHLSIPVAIKEYYPTGIVQRHTQISTQVQTIKENTLEFFARHKDRFLKEARTLAQLANIPEIVQVRSFFAANDTVYIVMEYIQGITLKQHLKALGRPMTEEEALDIMEPLLKALQKVHDQGLIHRDISPDNIMIPTEGGIKLIDFGTVRYMDDSGISQATESVLKPGFSPMEQYNTRGNLGTWTDVYAVSATFHYLLTGKVPPEVLQRLEVSEQLTALYDQPGLSDNLIDALEMGMKARPADRIQTIRELYDLLYVRKTAPTPAPAPKSTSSKKKIISLIAALFLISALAGSILLLPDTKEVAETVPTESAETVPTQETVPETTVKTEELTVLWNETKLQPLQVFGNITGSGKDTVTVCVDGQPVSDFTVRSDDPEFLEATRISGGKIKLVQLESFGGRAIGFTVTYNESDYTFYCIDDSWTHTANSGSENAQAVYPTSFYERRYTDAGLQALVDADLSFEEACDKLTTIADTVQYLKFRGYRFEHMDSAIDAATRFAMNCGDGVGNSMLFNALLKGDYEEQGYLYIYYGRGDNILSYFVIDGMYYFCDFVFVFGDGRDSPILHATNDPSTLYNALLARDPNQINNTNSDLYLVSLFTVRTDNRPTMPSVWLRGGNYCQIPFTPAEKDSLNILFMREGYTFEFGS